VNRRREKLSWKLFPTGFLLVMILGVAHLPEPWSRAVVALAVPLMVAG